MKLREQAVVVIPVYKEALAADEKLSFAQCLRVLGRHPITLVAPQGLALDAYRSAHVQLGVRRFDATYFQSARTYNRLMLAPSFYAAFLRWQYILIYQLDAFVFSDQLAEWCRRGYDYVGAPWIGADWLDHLPIQRPRWSRNNIVGNGGFSLRRVISHLALSILFRRAARRWPANEDGFWAFYAPSRWPLFKLPSTEEALRFSFEMNPAECYQRAGRVLPFGCHAWDKHDRAFWRPFIESGR